MKMATKPTSSTKEKPQQIGIVLVKASQVPPATYGTRVLKGKIE
jgi:hypothetical protein